MSGLLGLVQLFILSVGLLTVVTALGVALAYRGDVDWRILALIILIFDSYLVSLFCSLQSLFSSRFILLHVSSAIFMTASPKDI